MRPDPYAAHDAPLTRRFAGLMQLLTGAALLLVALIGSSRPELFGTLILASFAAATGVALLRGWAASYDTLLGLTYVNLVGLTVLTVLAGAQSDQIEELYLGVLLSGAALHPPRRVVPVFVLLVAGVLVGKADGGITRAECVDVALHLTIWLFVAAMSSLTVKDLREQRLHARHDGEVAQQQAMTDALTGLANRRQLLVDLDAAVADDRPSVLALFDLDGFKAYNDTFGHPAGDALLRRLGEQLAAAVAGCGNAYRMGGDEFCALMRTASHEADAVIAAAVGALSQHGGAFTVTASHGVIELPAEARSTGDALRVVDQRMYARKSAGRASAAQQSTDVLLRVLAERQPALGDHLEGVAAMCERVARRLRVPDEDMTVLVQAATLHDVGKAAIPDAILNKPGSLDADEWAFMRRHTLIGERILAAAPALTRAAAIVRASHERFDGAGYPDGIAGENIPLAARIIFACDAFDAMVAERPYRAAMTTAAAVAELHSCAGTQFDPEVVAAFAAIFSDDAAGVKALRG